MYVKMNSEVLVFALLQQQNMPSEQFPLHICYDYCLETLDVLKTSQ